MLPLVDAQVRLVLLNHVAVRLAEAQPDELHAAGIENEQLARLRQLSALDLNRLATMRDLTIGVTFDAAELTAGLRTVSLVNEAKALEAYFIRHGASWQMMSALFKIRRKVTLRRRRDCGAWRPSGRFPLPDTALRDRIYRAWRWHRGSGHAGSLLPPASDVSQLPIAVLEAVLRAVSRTSHERAAVWLRRASPPNCCSTSSTCRSASTVAWSPSRRA
jgi:predicted DCC family thiol-disulfide oxidoreductase YuxK